MSMQDDMFDIADALKRKPALKEAFHNIIRHLNVVEQELEDAEKELRIVREFRRWLLHKEKK